MVFDFFCIYSCLIINVIVFGTITWVSVTYSFGSRTSAPTRVVYNIYMPYEHTYVAERERERGGGQCA